MLIIIKSSPFQIFLVENIMWRFCFCFFFLSEFSFKDTNNSQDSKGRDRTNFYSTLPLPPAHEHSDIFATLHVRWLSHIFNHNTFIYHTATQWDLPPYWITIWLFDDVMLISVCLLDDLILDFCYSNLKLKTGELKLASTITIALQATRLNKCARHPLPSCFLFYLVFSKLTELHFTSLVNFCMYGEKQILG